MALSDLLTNSRAKCSRACLRKHEIVYELGYRPLVEAEALAFGTLWHVGGMEVYWNGLRRYESRELVLGTARAHLQVHGKALDPFLVAKAEAMLEGYVDRWFDEDAERYEVLSVEQEFRAPLVNPATGRASSLWKLGGKLDLLLRDRADGALLFGEHKSSGEDIAPGGSYWTKLRMDSQVSVYFAGAAALGHVVDGCLYDVAKKPGQRPLKANSKRASDETPKEYRERCRAAIAEEPAAYFQRQIVVRLEDELAEGMHDIWQQGQIIRESRNAGRWPRNPDACDLYHRDCEYLPVCSGMASLDDATKYRRLDNVHPELSAPTNEETDHG